MMDFRNYVLEKINEEDGLGDVGNAADVFENLSEIVTRLADFFTVVGTKGNLYASGDSKRAMIDIRKMVNSVNAQCDNKDKIFTDAELASMRRIAEGLRDVVGKKVVALSKDISERQKKDEEKNQPEEPIQTEVPEE